MKSKCLVCEPILHINIHRDTQKTSWSNRAHKWKKLKNPVIIITLIHTEKNDKTHQCCFSIKTINKLGLEVTSWKWMYNSVVHYVLSVVTTIHNLKAGCRGELQILHKTKTKNREKI